jgi:hypothetical protein
MGAMVKGIQPSWKAKNCLKAEKSKDIKKLEEIC